MSLAKEHLLLFVLVFSLCLSFGGTRHHWIKSRKWNKGLPSSVNVYHTRSAFAEGLPMSASFCEFDLSDPDLELRVGFPKDGRARTPQEFIEEEPNHVYMLINGGFFNVISNVSESLVMQDGQVTAPSIDVVQQKYQKRATNYYTTRGAIGIYENGTAEVAWTYSPEDHPSKVYAYQEPASNCYRCNPGPIPNKHYPVAGHEWEVKTALGAGPMLIKDGMFDLTFEEELINITRVVARHPRSAICITKENKLLSLVVDGRSKESAGLFYEELTELMLTLGCQDALNLDGGGSTAMYVNGDLINKPSDPVGIRPVTSVLMLVSKTKPNLKAKKVIVE